MKDKNLNVTLMIEIYAKAISVWKYENEYAFYNNDEGDIEEFMDGTYYACTLENGELIGYFCFGKGAQIPTVEENVYDDASVDIGLGLRPDLCGKGMGLVFFSAGLEYAKAVLDITHFRLSVAAFNERAIKLYKNAGFAVECEVTNSYYKNRFLIMKKSF